MFIDGSSVSKQRAVAASATAVPLRLTDTNKLKSTVSLPESMGNRRKARKPIQIIQEIINQNNNENRSSPLVDRRATVGFNDGGVESSSSEQRAPADDASHSPALVIDSTHDSTTTVSVIGRARERKRLLHYRHAISSPIDRILVLSKAVIDALFAHACALSDWTTLIRELRSTYFF